MKRRIAVLLCLCVLFSLASMASAAETKSDDIVILHTNDVHCGVSDGLGYAGVAAYKADMEAAYNYVTLVDCGDAIQGEPIGMVSAGAYLVDIMNELGYDYATFGNHEYDFKLPRLAELTQQADYTYLSCNFKYIGSDATELVYQPYEIADYGGTKVAFIGITTPESFVKSTPAYFKDEAGNYIYSFSEDKTGAALYDAVQETVDEARSEGADYVVALAHLGVEGTTEGWTSEDVIAHTTGIDAVLDGHSHEAFNKLVANKEGIGVLLAQTGTKLQNLGKLTIHTGGIITEELISSSVYTKKDAHITEYIKTITDSFEGYTAEVVGRTNVPLAINDENGNRIIRNQETNLGDLCADAYRVMMDADIGIMNGGGIRKAVQTGDITRSDLLSVFPWGNLPCKIELTGQQVLDMLEMGASKYPSENGGFLHVSGLKYTILGGVPSSVETSAQGEFVKVAGGYRVCNVQVLNKESGLYEPLDLEKTYTLGGIDYTIIYCGDGFTMFQDAKILRKAEATYTDAHMLVDYIKNKLGGTVGEEYAAPQSRITVYSDIKASDWYLDAVRYVLSAGLMNGTGKNFSPNASLTRGMLVTILYREAGSPRVQTKVSQKFSDCEEESWYAPAVVWAAENGIVGGYEDGTFAPNKPITRQEMAKVLYGYDKVSGKAGENFAVQLSYTDLSSIASWALEGVNYCTAAKYLSGSNGAFDPNGTATRAMVAQVFWNMAK